jgi:hypothetical protein
MMKEKECGLFSRWEKEAASGISETKRLRLLMRKRLINAVLPESFGPARKTSASLSGLSSGQYAGTPQIKINPTSVVILTTFGVRRFSILGVGSHL